jgi:deoxycytidylate deaminase
MKKLYFQCLQIAKQNIHRCIETNNHFSFIIQDNTIISWGYNRRGQVHKKFGYKWYSNIHSEVDAYGKALKRLDKSKAWSIINIRLNNQLETMLSSPCECCEQFISILGCNRVLFSTVEGFNKIVL